MAPPRKGGMQAATFAIAKGRCCPRVSHHSRHYFTWAIILLHAALPLGLRNVLDKKGARGIGLENGGKCVTIRDRETLGVLKLCAGWGARSVEPLLRDLCLELLAE